MASGSLYKCSRCQLRVGGDVVEYLVGDAVSEELTALWKSNVSPTSEKEPRAGYTATSYALEVIESRIRELSASLQSFVETRERIAEKKRIYHSILHPIRRLPPEILAEIFRICTFGNMDLEYTDFPGSLDTRKAPWTLSQVCQTWRSVATSTSSLWTRVDVMSDTISRSWESRVMLEALLSIQLERSRGHNIELSYTNWSGANDCPLLSSCCSQASRWGTVQLESDAGGLDRLRYLRGAFRSLKRLEICFGRRWTADLISPFCAFEDCPSLTELSLRGGAQVLLPDEVQFPWGQIIRYEARLDDIGAPRRESYSRTLQKLERVEVCILDSVTCVNDHDTLLSLLSSPLKLRSLHTLVMGNVDEFSMEILLGWLVLPALRVLRFCEGFSHPAEMVQFFDRSQCSLEELAIAVICPEGSHSSDEFHDNLTRVLEASALHNLRRLQIRRRRFVDEDEDDHELLWKTVLETLTLGRKGRAQVMPRLPCLVLDARGYNCDTSTIGDDGVLTMASSRCYDTSQVGGSDEACRLEELTFWNIGAEGTTPLQKGSMENLMELSSSSGLTCSWHWGNLNWFQVD
ncbi:hypothetical protein PQX77_011241 [Marasmius sp. AFHP31]|nr:hypothetical protein PQX77_011241 [Marasmius sp. AFHP31]